MISSFWEVAWMTKKKLRQRHTKINTTNRKTIDSWLFLVFFERIAVSTKIVVFSHQEIVSIFWEKNGSIVCKKKSICFPIVFSSSLSQCWMTTSSLLPNVVGLRTGFICGASCSITTSTMSSPLFRSHLIISKGPTSRLPSSPDIWDWRTD